MKESDWKVFKKIKEAAIETFCRNALQDFEQVIEDEKQQVHERYVSFYRLVHSRDNEMARLFDGHSRSRAPLQLIAIRAAGLADETLLSKLSDEFRDETNPHRFGG